MEQYPRRDMLGSKEKHKEQAYRELYEWMEVAVVSILCMVVLFTFAFRFASVDGNSMKPTLHNRDWLLVSGLFYQPQPGDVVVVTQQGDPEHPLIKRIIATEFQEVDIDFEAGVVYVDGKALEEPYVNAPTTSQYAAITALKECDGEIDRMRDEYNMRRRLVVRSFNDMGLTCFEPRGAFYAFPCIKSTGMSSQDFCTKLLEQKHVAIIPGDAFGASGEGYARISYAYSVEHLKEALRRIREFLQENGIYHGI